MKDHGTIEKVSIIPECEVVFRNLFQDADRRKRLRIVYWWRHKDGNVYRHTSYFSVEGDAERLAEIINAANP